MQVIKKKHNDLILLNINLTVSQHIKALLQTFSNGYDMSMNREENKKAPLNS